MIIGSGQHGHIRLSQEAEHYFKEKGCYVEVHPTPKAIHVWNRAEGRSFHRHVPCDGLSAVPDRTKISFGDGGSYGSLTWKDSCCCANSACGRRSPNAVRCLLNWSPSPACSRESAFFPKVRCQFRRSFDCFRRGMEVWSSGDDIETTPTTKRNAEVTGVTVSTRTIPTRY